MDKEEDGQGVGDVLSILTPISGLPVPAPLQKTFWKAFSRLTGALVDIPAAKLEARAEEIRSETEARKALTLRAAHALAEKFEGNPELAARAQARVTSKILREQVNVEDVLAKAAEALSGENPKEEPKAEPEEDWWNAFEEEATKKSSDEMKTVFGRILAGELVRPGTFSIRSVRTVGELDRGTAATFAKLCSLALSSPIEGRVASLGANASTNGLQHFGIGFDSLQLLEQFGLVNSDYNSWRDYSPLAGLPFLIDYAGKAHKLVRISDEPKPLKLHGVYLTKVGHELRRIVSLTELPAYTMALTKFLQDQGYALVPVRVVDA